MAQKNPEILKQLDQQAAVIGEIFASAKCELIAPDILQPADIFLDRSGENIRQRAYVFSDSDGNELCLRPDLTVPACRVYLHRHPEGEASARYSYRGPAFRYQPFDEAFERPREFEQMGVEFFGAQDAEASDAEVLNLAMQALAGVGLKNFAVHIGDLGLFTALADGIDMPARWRDKMKHHFWRPKAFRDLLDRLSRRNNLDPNSERAKILNQIKNGDDLTLLETLERVLDQGNMPLLGLRRLDEIADGLKAQLADRVEKSLDKELVAEIGNYLAIDAPARQAFDQVGLIAKRLGIDIALAQQAFVRRLDLMEAQGIDVSQIRFTAEFGRNMEYYTGFVFQLEMPGNDIAGQIAGGGRYDDLLLDIGAPRLVPAVGCAIHTERLAALGAGQ